MGFVKMVRRKLFIEVMISYYEYFFGIVDEVEIFNCDEMNEGFVFDQSMKDELVKEVIYDEVKRV